MKPRTTNIQLVINLVVYGGSIERFRLYIEHGVVLESNLNGWTWIQYPFIDDTNAPKRIVDGIILVFN